LSLIKAWGCRKSVIISLGLVHQTEATMSESIRAGGEKQARLFNPFLDLSIMGLETQLKVWRTYQVEGTRFVAKRMRANLEHLRALGHCCDAQAIGECQRAWLGNLQKDYAEEWGRIAATTFTMGFADLAGLAWLFGQRTTRESPQAQPDPGPQAAQQPKSPWSLATAA
jgi:hypothetical protein